GERDRSPALGRAVPPPHRRMTPGASSNWSPRSPASRNWSPSCCWTRGCSRTWQKKGGDGVSAESLCGLPPGDLPDLPEEGEPDPGPLTLDAPLPGRLARGRLAVGQGHQAT